jgi:diguanylate cyclase
MKPTDRTLLDQLRITELEIEHRKRLFSFDHEDVKALQSVRPLVEDKIDELVEKFYEAQTSEPDIALLIGDADTLLRLRAAQRKYVLGLFAGSYNLDYVNNRLRIGLVHKRIGVEPKLYLAAVQALRESLDQLLGEGLPDPDARARVSLAIDKLFMFDVALVFETYIRSLVAEIETSKDRSEQYARSLEEKVRERTKQLEEMARTDPLTGLLNFRHLEESLSQALLAARRRSEPLTIAYIDVNNFKYVNDTLGHQRGDEILRSVAAVLTRSARVEDRCFRYGGDEFCVILPNMGEVEAQRGYRLRVEAELARLKEPVTVSMGFVEAVPPDYLAPEEMIKRADTRMYAVKGHWKANVVVESAA